MFLVDIYDGDHEPMIFHGKTLTSKVQVREVCEVIKKYGFIASPYPIIISAEIHCCVAQQELLVEIMSGVFGDTLVRAPIEDRPVLEKLPSPEELKGKVLFKVSSMIAVGFLYIFTNQTGHPDKESVAFRNCPDGRC